MTTRLLLCVLAAGLGLAGCAPVQTKDNPPFDRDYISCASNKCDIEVTVNNCLAERGITVNIKALEVRGRNVKLQWTIVTQNYKFATDGIVIKDYDSKREFTDPTRESDKIYSWKYKASPDVKKVYEYGVYVERIDPSASCLPYDPWVRN